MSGKSDDEPSNNDDVIPSSQDDIYSSSPCTPDGLDTAVSRPSEGGSTVVRHDDVRGSGQSTGITLLTKRTAPESLHVEVTPSPKRQRTEILDDSDLQIVEQVSPDGDLKIVFSTQDSDNMTLAAESQADLKLELASSYTEVSQVPCSTSTVFSSEHQIGLPGCSRKNQSSSVGVGDVEYAGKDDVTSKAVGRERRSSPLHLASIDDTVDAAFINESSEQNPTESTLESTTSFEISTGMAPADGQDAQIDVSPERDITPLERVPSDSPSYDRIDELADAAVNVRVLVSSSPMEPVDSRQAKSPVLLVPSPPIDAQGALRRDTVAICEWTAAHHYGSAHKDSPACLLGVESVDGSRKSPNVPVKDSNLSAIRSAAGEGAQSADVKIEDMRRVFENVADELSQEGLEAANLRHMSFTFQQDDKYLHVNFEVDCDGSFSMKRNTSSSSAHSIPSVDYHADISSKSGSDPSKRASFMSSRTVSTIEGRGARLSTSSSLDRQPATGFANSTSKSRPSVMVVNTFDSPDSDGSLPLQQLRGSRFIKPKARFRPPGQPVVVSTSQSDHSESIGGKTSFDSHSPEVTNSVHADISTESVSMNAIVESGDSEISHITGTTSSPEISEIPAVVDSSLTTGRRLSDAEEDELSDREQCAMRTKKIESGLQCFALWADGCYYPGLVKRYVRDDRWEVLFDDGDRREVPVGQILPAQTLWRGLSVFVKVDSVIDYYDTAIITGHRLNSDGALDYVVSLDSNNDTWVVPRSRILLTRDQAADILRLRTSATLGQTVASPARNLLSLDNLVEGRRPRGSTGLRVLAGLDASNSELEAPSAGERKGKKLSYGTPSKDKKTTGRTKPRSESTSNTPQRRSSRTTTVSTGAPSTSQTRSARERVTTPSNHSKNVGKRPRASTSRDEPSTNSSISDDNGSVVQPRKGSVSSNIKEGKCKQLADAATELSTPLEDCPLTKSALLKGMAFVVSCSSASFPQPRPSGTHKPERVVAFNKSLVTNHIECRGGTVVTQLDSLELTAKRLELLLLSDRPSRTEKFISCLAAGVPCIHLDWLVQSVRQNKRLPLADFLLPASESQGCPTVPQNVTAPRTPLRGLKVGVADVNGESQWLSLMIRILASMGATVEHFDSDLSDAGRPHMIDVLVTQPSSPAAVINWAVSVDVPVVSGEWVIACVVRRARLEFDDQPEFQCPVDTSIN